MSVNVKQSYSMTLRDFERELDRLPAETFYQLNEARTFNDDTIDFRINAPSPNALLDSHALLEIPIYLYVSNAKNMGQITLSTGANPDVASAIFQNISMYINGAIVSLNVGDYINELNSVMVGREDAKRHFGTCGGDYEQLDQVIETTGLAVAGQINTDDRTDFINLPVTDGRGSTAWKGNSQAPEGEFDKQVKQLIGAVDVNIKVDSGAGTRLINTQIPGGADEYIRIVLTVPVCIPPFNYYGGLYNKYAWGKMSRTIPHLNNGFTLTMRLKSNLGSILAKCLSLDYGNLAGTDTINTDKILAKIGMTDATINNALQTVAPVLRLKYYIPPSYVNIPQQVVLQSWDVNAQPRAETITLNVGATRSITTNYLQFNQMPDLFMLYVKRSESQAESQNNQAGSNNTRHNYLAIESIKLTINSKNSAINTNISQRELYEMTKECANDRNDYAWDFHTWATKRSIICLNQVQLANLGIPSGVTGQTNVQVTFNVKNCNNDNIAGESFNAWVVPIYFKRYIALTPTEGQTGSQSIDPNVALADIMGRRQGQEAEGSAVRTGGAYVKRV